jgi:hypothetical protein
LTALARPTRKETVSHTSVSSPSPGPRAARRGRRIAAIVVALLATLVAGAAEARAADNLQLAPGLSFSDDSSASFPIAGDHAGDATVGDGRATIAFFGTAHCWNTNREAERVVALYPKYRDRVRFVIVDVDHPSEDQRALIARHFRGAIPTVVVIAPDGKVLYSRAGETGRTRGDTTRLDELLGEAAGG